MREALWPSPARAHAGEIERYFAGTWHEPIEVLIACDAQGAAIGVIELSIRAYAEGCATDRVAFVEGWYVEPTARMRGIGTALIRAAEEWAPLAVGFTETEWFGVSRNRSEETH